MGGEYINMRPQEIFCLNVNREGEAEARASASLMTSYLPLEDKVTDEADDNVDLTSFPQPS